MKCPICATRTGIEIDMHADGYAKNVLECTNCGALWVNDRTGIIIVNKKVA